MIYLINYILIGFLVGFLMEYSVQKLTGDTFTWGERMFIITLWPLSLLAFISGFFTK